MADMDLNYPSHAVDAMLSHRYGGVSPSGVAAPHLVKKKRKKVKHGVPAGGRTQAASGAMIAHRYPDADR